MLKFLQCPYLTKSHLIHLLNIDPNATQPLIRMKKIILLIAASMAVSLAADASLTAYEGFNYTNALNSAVNGLNGGTGWATAYKTTSSSIVLSNNLSFNGVYSPSSTKALCFKGSSVDMGAGQGRDWASTNTVPPNGVYWYSFLCSPVSGSKGTFSVFEALGDNQNGLGMRLDLNGSDPQFKAWNPSQSAGGNINFPGGYGSTFFVLGQLIYTNGATATNTIWVYQNGVNAMPTAAPAIGAANSSTATAGWTGNADKVRSTMGGRAFSGNVAISYDEIRIGTSFADVLPPTSLVWNGDGTANAWNNTLGNTDWLVGSTANYFQTGNYVSFTDASTNQTVNINDLVQPNVVTVNSASNYVFTGTGAISNSASLSITGSGTLTVQNTNLFTGGTIVSGGVLVVATNNALGSGVISMNSGSKRLVINNGVTLTNSINIAAGSGSGNSGQGLIQNSGAGNATLSGGSITYNGTQAAGGLFSSTGGGTLTVADPINSSITVGLAVRLGTIIFSGGGSYPQIEVGNGTMMLGANNGLCVTSLVKIATADTSTSYLDLAGFNQTLGGLLQGYTAIVGNSSTTSDSVLTINGSSSFSGTIQDILGAGTHKLSLTVTNGALTLSGANTYTGNTTITGGMLTVNGSLAAGSAVSVSGKGILSGTGTVGGNVTVGTGGSVQTPAGAGNIGSIAIGGNYVLTGGGTNTFDVGGGVDSINVWGAFSASGTTVINLVGVGGVSPGTYTLINAASGAPLIGNFTLTYSGNFGTLTPSLQVSGSQLNVVLQDLSDNVTWRGDGSANIWNLSTSSTNWYNNNTSMLWYFKNADTTTFDDSSVNFTVNITTNVAPAAPTLEVNNSVGNYVFNGTGKITGPTTLQKDGTSNLTINTTNDYSGGTIINGGKVKMGNASALGTGSTALNAGGTLDVNGTSLLFASDFGGILDSSAGTPVITISNNSALSLSGFITNSGGSLSLVKVGSGDLTINNPSFYSGGTIISNDLVAAAVDHALGSGTITLAAGSKRLVINDGATLTNNVVINVGSGVGNSGQGMIQNSGGGNATLNGGTITVNGIATAGGVFASTGGGTLTIGSAVNSPVTLQNGIRTGTVIFSGGGSYPQFDVGNGSIILGANNGLCTTSIVQLATVYPSTCVLDLAGFNQTLGGLLNGGGGGVTGGTTPVVGNSSTTTDSLLTTVGTSSYSGIIQDVVGSGTMKTALKVAGGSLTLSGANTYTGNTTVTGGSLLVNGSLASGSSVLVTNGNLGGTGTIGGNTTVTNTGTLTPGSGGVGTLTFSGNLTLKGNALFELNRSVNPSNDFVNVTGTLTGGGTLVVTNIGATVLTNGNTFKLFSGPVSGFTTVTLPTLATGLGWTNTLATDGSIAVISTYTTPSPTNITYTVNGNQLVLNWPSGQGWLLQAQTNNLGTGLTTNWSTMIGITPPFTNNINAANPTVFYRLTAP